MDIPPEVPNQKMDAGWQRLLTAQSSRERPVHDEDFDGDIILTVASMFIEKARAYYGICRNT